MLLCDSKSCGNRRHTGSGRFSNRRGTPQETGGTRRGHQGFSPPRRRTRAPGRLAGRPLVGHCRRARSSGRAGRYAARTKATGAGCSQGSRPGRAARAAGPRDQAPAAGKGEPSDQPSGQAKPAPGQFTVDEEAAERALERTLVAAGALLVPFGQAEVQPTFNYTRREQDVPTSVQVGTSISFPTEKVKRNELTGTLNLRGGLPWDSQLEFGLPYNYAQQEQVLDLPGVATPDPGPQRGGARRLQRGSCQNRRAREWLAPRSDC